MPQVKRTISACFYVYAALMAGIVIYVSTQYPIYNWDIVPYVGGVLNIDIKDSAALHAMTYQVLLDNIPNADFNRLVAGSYADAVYLSPEVFQAQLNFYLIKPFYIFSIYLVTLFGPSIVESIAMISLGATLFSGCLVLYWINRYTNPHIAFIFTLLIGLQSRLFDLGRIATPDALSVSVVLLSLFILFEKKQIIAAASLITFAVIIRSNNIIFAVLFLSYFSFFCFKQKRFFEAKFSAGLLGLAVCLYFAIGGFFQGYSWWTLFYHSFVEKLNIPSQLNVTFSLDLYLSILIQQAQALLVPGLASPSTMLIFILLLGISGLITLKKQNVQPFLQPCLAVSIMILINFSAHFILFPGVEQWDRFFTSFYAFSAIMLIAKSRDLNGFNLPIKAHP